MASLSGTINSSTVGGGYKLEIDWSATQSTSANTSTITMNVYWVSLGSSYTISSSATKTGSTSITASTGSGTGSDSWSVAGASLSGNQKRLLHTYTHTVTHDTNGNWSGTLASTFNCAVDLGGMVNSVTASGSVTLTQIPRKSVISGSYNFTAGSNLTVNITRYSTSFTHTVTLWTLNTDGTTWNQIGSALTGQATSATFDMSSSPPNANATDVFTSLAGRSSCSVWVRIETFSGGTSLGYNDYKSGTCTSPAASTGVIGNPAGVSITAGQESSTVYIDQSITINLTTHVSGVTHTINFKDGNTGNIIHQATNVTTTVSWTPSTTVNSYYSASYTERNALYKATPNSIELDGQIDIYTYYGGKIVMAATNVDINYRVRNSNPTFTGTGITYKDNNTAVAGVTGSNQYIVQNASDLLVSLPTTANATAQNYATMSYYTASLGGVTKQTNYSSSATITFDLGLINLTANDNVIVTAFDSRGNSTVFNLPVNIVAWKPPAITSTSKRADGFSDPTNITLSGTYSKVTISAADKNSIIYAKYQYKKTTDATYPVSPNAGCLTAFPGFTSGSGTFSTSPTLSVTLDSTLAWNTEVQVLDAIQQALAQTAAVKDNTVAVGTPLVFFDTALNSVGIGKFPEVAGRLEVQGTINSYESVGVVNPNTPFTTGATLALSFSNDQARIRYGGNGNGSANGLQIQGTSDAVKWSVSDAGDVNNYGLLYVINGKNFYLKAATGSVDPGDIVFQNGDGTEKIRVYTGAANNELYIRQNGNRNLLSWDVNGDATFGATADPTVVNIPNGSLYIANSTASTVLRLVTDSTTAYVQGGKDLNDTVSKMVLSRTGTVSANLHQMYIYTDQLWFPQQYTTLSALTSANMAINSGGLVNKMGSSKDFKLDIEDLWESQAEKILQLRPVMYKANPDMTIDRPDWSTVGLIAEEVAEVDPRLAQYDFAYDKENNPNHLPPTSELKPIGVNYDKIGVYLIPIVRQLRDEVAELKKRLTY